MTVLKFVVWFAARTPLKMMNVDGTTYIRLQVLLYFNKICDKLTSDQDIKYVYDNSSSKLSKFYVPIKALNSSRFSVPMFMGFVQNTSCVLNEVAEYQLCFERGCRIPVVPQTLQGHPLCPVHTLQRVISF